MAHLLVLADTYTNFHHCFKAFMDKRGQSYKHPWGVKTREIKLYDIVYSEKDEEQLLKDLKHFEYERLYNDQSNFIKRLIAKITKKFMKVELIDMSKVEPTKFTDEEKHIIPYPHWFCYTKVIGKVKDVYHGEEEMI